MDAQQQQPTQMHFPDTVGSPTVSQLHPSLASFLLRYEGDIDDFIHYLRGETPRINADGEVIEWEKPEQNAAGEWVKGREPIMNDQGVYEFQRYLKGLTSKIITVSQVDNEQWRQDLLSNVLSIYSTLFLNYHNYALKPNKYELLCTELTNFAEFSFSKAKNQFMGELIHPKYTSTEHIFTQKQADDKNKGLTSFLKF